MQLLGKKKSLMNRKKYQFICNILHENGKLEISRNKNAEQSLWQEFFTRIVGKLFAPLASISGNDQDLAKQNVIFCWHTTACNSIFKYQNETLPGKKIGLFFGSVISLYVSKSMTEWHN